MDLLIHPEVFDKYFTRDSFIQNELDVIVFNIFNNENAKIIFDANQKNALLERYKNSNKLIAIELFITNLIENRRTVKSEIRDKKVDNDYFIAVNDIYPTLKEKSDFLLCVLLNKNELIEEKIANNLVIVSEGLKANKSSLQWMKTQIAAYSNLSVRYFDFADQYVFYHFIKSLFSLPTFQDVIIIDRYLNFFKEWDIFNDNRNFTIFENLQNKNFKVFTLNADEKVLKGGALNDFNIKVSDKIELFSTENHDLIHERKLFFHNFVFEADDDLASIRTNRETWKIDIAYDKKLSDRLKDKLQYFNAFQIAISSNHQIFKSSNHKTMSKPSIPEGTRDFGPEQVVKRNYIFDTIKKVFVKYGFQPLETPTMEKLSTLTGKYGEEGDRLIFKILNNGDFLAKANKEAIETGNSTKLVSSISERGLRYDLTVPFARFVVMNQHALAFPFKRYQIQPVWRADRPQRGRYREFYQCDVDVIGSNSILYEAELVQIYDEVFANLKVNVVIKINNRKVLEGIAEAAGVKEKFMDMTVAIDKLDKIGMEGVEKELTERGINQEAIDKIKVILGVKNLDILEKLFAESEIGLKGIEELRTFHRFFDLYEAKNEIEFDITLARGLNYYTGCIFEVVAKDAKMGSIGGGGRYDDLTGVFGLKNMSGVGVSFGAERIYDIMEELNLFPEENLNQVKVLIITMDDASHLFGFQCVTQLRQSDIAADIYPEPAKMKKQMEYANKRKYPFVAIIGEAEMEAKKLMLKNMETGEQSLASLEELLDLLK